MKKQILNIILSCCITIPSLFISYSFTLSKTNSKDYIFNRTTKYVVKINNVQWVSTRRASYSFTFKIISSNTPKTLKKESDTLLYFNIYIGGNLDNLLNEFSNGKKNTNDFPSAKLETINSEKLYQIKINKKGGFTIKSLDRKFKWESEGNNPEPYITL